MGVDMQEVIYTYREGAAEGSLAGVPTRDLTNADLARLPKWLVVSVEASPLYEKVSKRSDPARRPSATKADEDLVPVSETEEVSEEEE